MRFLELKKKYLVMDKAHTSLVLIREPVLSNPDAERQLPNTCVVI